MTIEQFNELVATLTHLKDKPFFKSKIIGVNRLNCTAFLSFALKKNIDFNLKSYSKDRIVTISMDVNFYELLRLVFSVFSQDIGDFAKSIFYSLSEQANTQINRHIHALEFGKQSLN